MFTLNLAVVSFLWGNAFQKAGIQLAFMEDEAREQKIFQEGKVEEKRLN
ncbi:MAG: hypothetical protein H5U07_06245 [Candidatus Aminicenantes bacterium]|nr:hypothetical protein [Candidatus Aminicenantes bacterium]